MTNQREAFTYTVVSGLDQKESCYLSLSNYRAHSCYIIRKILSPEPASKPHPMSPLLDCRSTIQQRANSVTSSIPPARPPSESESDHMRLGLRVEQRGSLRHLLRTLKQRLDVASSDLQVTCPLLYCCIPFGVVLYTLKKQKNTSKGQFPFFLPRLFVAMCILLDEQRDMPKGQVPISQLPRRVLK